MSANIQPITQLIQQIKSAELSQQKEIRIDMKAARQLSLSLNELLLQLHTKPVAPVVNAIPEKIVVQLDGGRL